MISDEISCPNCFTSGVTILEKRESKHLDNGIYYKIVELTLVCKAGCWHNWSEYYRVELKNFNEDERIVKLPLFSEKIINPDQINFSKE
ncbi:MAG: hypothetical protein GOP50_02075 [Candidatus Heimdallarchaeota archaeon]|nr:hypothetical protein [Candidatus Heimdallarchaeota archaeon]